MFILGWNLIFVQSLSTTHYKRSINFFLSAGMPVRRKFSTLNYYCKIQCCFVIGWKGSKVWTFWEAHKNLRNLLHALYIYLVNFKTMRKIFSNYVCFSKSPNFNKIRYSIFKNNEILSIHTTKSDRIFHYIYMYFTQID